MSAREWLVAGALVVVFLSVTGTFIALARWWSRRFSARSRGLAGRLKEVSTQRRGDAADSLSKSQPEPLSLWVASLLERLPGGPALEMVVVRSGTRHSLAEVAGLSLGLGAVAAVLAATLRMPWWAALIAVGLGASLPMLYLSRKQLRRRVAFEEQLPAALEYITRALRAGHGLTMAMGMVGDELPAPLGPEFKLAFDNINVGMPFDTAMSEMAERLDSSDLNFLVIALMIQRKTGGNLTELLGSLAATIRDRIKLNGKVRVLASEGKASGIVVGALPFLLGGLLTLVNPQYMSALWTTAAGLKVVGVSLMLMTLGGLWMWKITQIRV